MSFFASRSSSTTTPLLLLLLVVVLAALPPSSDAFRPQPALSLGRTPIIRLRMSNADEQARLLEQARKLREEAESMEASMRSEEAQAAKPAESSKSKSKSTKDAVREAMEKAAALNNKAVDGTFYDDEADSAPIKDGISDSMKQRLMREASTGLDSDKPQTNVILYISVVVAVLVALGGSGILY